MNSYAMPQEVRASRGEMDASSRRRAIVELIAATSVSSQAQLGDLLEQRIANMYRCVSAPVETPCDTCFVPELSIRDREMIVQLSGLWLMQERARKVADSLFVLL